MRHGRPSGGGIRSVSSSSLPDTAKWTVGSVDAPMRAAIGPDWKSRLIRVATRPRDWNLTVHRDLGAGRRRSFRLLLPAQGHDPRAAPCRRWNNTTEVASFDGK